MGYRWTHILRSTRTSERRRPSERRARSVHQRKQRNQRERLGAVGQQLGPDSWDPIPDILRRYVPSVFTPHCRLNILIHVFLRCIGSDSSYATPIDQDVYFSDFGAAITELL